MASEDKKIIFRDNFFRKIKIYFGEYKKQVIDNVRGKIEVAGQEKEIYLRHGFCRKLDLLCAISDHSPEWWDLTTIYIHPTTGITDDGKE